MMMAIAATRGDFCSWPTCIFEERPGLAGP
jgi:hypothetical protein